MKIKTIPDEFNSKQFQLEPFSNWLEATVATGNE